MKTLNWVLKNLNFSTIQARHMKLSEFVNIKETQSMTSFRWHIWGVLLQRLLQNL